MSSPKISIIVPVYNAAEFLPAALDSLRAQSYSNIEILCINDGSSDNSGSILQDYAEKDERIKIFTQENSGAARTRNVGLVNATGKYLMFCDADDCYAPSMCEEMVNCIMTHDTDLVMCDCDFIETGNHQRTAAAKKYHRLKHIGRFPLTYPLKSDINALLWNKIFKLDVIRQYTIRFLEGFKYEDNAFIYQYLAVSNSYYGLNKILYHYRLSPNSLMGELYVRKQYKELIDHIYLFEHAIHFMRRHNLFEGNKWILKTIQDKIYHVADFFSPDDLQRFLSLLRKRILSFYNEEDIKIYPLLHKCYMGNIGDIKDYFENPGVAVKKYCGGIIKRRVSGIVREYSICDIPIWKRRLTPNFRKYYIFGIQYRKKRLTDTEAANTRIFLRNTQEGSLLSPKKINKIGAMQMLMGMALYYKDLPTENKYIICIDCLHDKDAEAIDAYTFFLYLQSIHVKSKYILLKSNPLAQKISDLKDVELVNSQDDFLWTHAALIAQSRYIITSFGGTSFNAILKNLPSVKYIFIEHGVILLKKGVCNLYSPAKFDYILVPTKKTYDLYIRENKWPKEKMLISGLPRWDRLKKKHSSQKNIFMFFTWRKTFMKSPHLSAKYTEKIINLLTNPEFKQIIERDEIKVHISFHHSLFLYEVNIPKIPDYIHIVDSHHISQYISDTDLLITDFSSICFDFMRLNIPVLYYLFDHNEMYLCDEDQQYIIDALSAQEHLYNYCFNEGAVIEKVKHYVERSFILEDENILKNKSIFWQNDSNCETLYKELLRIADSN